MFVRDSSGNDLYSTYMLTFTFIHLANAFIQSDLQLLCQRLHASGATRGYSKCLAQGHIGVSVDSNLGVSHQRHVSCSLRHHHPMYVKYTQA